MKIKFLPLLIGVVLLSTILIGSYVFLSQEGISEAQARNKVLLSVPYITQAPGNNWNNPWGNACEEASAAMIEAYYHGRKSLPQSDANKTMEAMFIWEDERFGKNEDTTAEENKEFMNALTLFEGIVVRNPTLEDIKKELSEGRPVIAHVNKFDFYRERVTDEKYASFHVFVIIGYDEGKKQFIINDPARTQKNYSYDRVMNSLHDLGESGEADGEPTVLFTHIKK